MLQRAHYSAPLSKFIIDSDNEILGEIVRHYHHDLVDLQRDAWLAQLKILKEGVDKIDGFNDAYIALEYGIPRMGKRVDTILYVNGIVFVVEFKVGGKKYERNAIDQVLGYSLDLKNFHNKSHALHIAPVLIATHARSEFNQVAKIYDDNVHYPLRCNKDNYIENINAVVRSIEGDNSMPAMEWFNSQYKPSPNIIEAAQALYGGHRVEEISRSDATAENLSTTATSIFSIVESAKRNNEKSICFVTGVPGAGKTLAGLNIATKRYCENSDEHAVFLSGNLPLVRVLQEALAQDKMEQEKKRGKRIKKAAALAETKAFIQNIHHFRDEYLGADSGVPSEAIAIFDEAQRAWTLEKTSEFMNRKRSLPDFDQSEPEFLISVLDRHETWAVIVCLVGSGQEIHTGEAGISEWFAAIQKSFNHWKVYISEQLDEAEYSHVKKAQIMQKPGLHLSVSIRSFRSEKVSAFVHSLLEDGADSARTVFSQIENYPIVLTRDIRQAKQWINDNARGTERTGIVASSSGGRLKPYGINVKEKIDPAVWFLNDKSDVRSSNFLEYTATEFDIQGLELDWVCMAWDADLCRLRDGWRYRNFIGTDWRNIHNDIRKNYLLNSYRVLLTRARQGMVIFVPEGDDSDWTREPKDYDSIFRYLRECGVVSL